MVVGVPNMLDFIQSPKVFSVEIARRYHDPLTHGSVVQPGAGKDGFAGEIVNGHI